jgi:Na+-transporting NADH:ubiquinone oxidoreductase subunit NqrB
VQTLFVLFKTNNWGSLKSALITALGLSLLLQSNSLEIYFIAAVVAICGKFIFRFRGKHIFNPANFGIITVLLFTNDAWVSPGQWGSNALLLMLVGCLGLIVLLRVKRLDTAFTFLFVFLGLHCIRNVFYLGWPADFFFHQLTTGSLLLFTFFMITDPMTTPSSKTARIIWASLVGVLAWWLSTKQFIHTAPLWALIALSPLVPLLDAFFPAQKFIWNH